MSEQLSMFNESSENDKKKDVNNVLSLMVTDTEENETLESEYELLDIQLSNLMLELNNVELSDTDEVKKTEHKHIQDTLQQCALDLSKSTREGSIAILCSDEKQSLLLKTSVTGQVGDYKPLILDKGYLYLNRYWQYQQNLADQINTRIKNVITLGVEHKKWAEYRLEEYFPEDESNHEINWQKRAAELALTQQFLIVSGGPGTGKTTTITRLLALLIEQNIKLQKGKKVGGADLKVLLAAPTGKAAIRMLDSMREATSDLVSSFDNASLSNQIIELMPKQASTIHKLLGYQANKTHFKHNKDKQLNADIVLVDEASMIDVALMSKLVEAVPLNTKLILIGDKDQLASVETGSVFADMCQALEQSEQLVTLQKNWRFSADSDIGQSAIAANNGDHQRLLAILTNNQNPSSELISPELLRDDDLIKPWFQYFKVVNNPESSLDDIFNAFNHYRVLCALRRGYNGSETMNNRIEVALEKQGLINTRNSAWYHGRPVMIKQNSYNKGLMNGDTGICLIQKGELTVCFPNTQDNSNDLNSINTYKSFTPIRLPAHETTWAMTIHKSQGSEFNQVVLILPQEEMPLLTRQLIYTGITRAKESMSIVASKKVLTAGVKTNVEQATRISLNLN